MSEKKYVIVLAGPTAVGKTDLSLKLAKYYDTEIISADSRQFYKELNIGTAKPSVEELAEVKHHFINSHSITTAYNVGQYEVDALQVIEKLFQKKKVAILTGGSGLFIKAVCEGMDKMPEVDKMLRAELAQRFEKEGLERLAEELQKLDPEYYETVDKQNPHRIMRALEVCLSTGKPFSSFRTQHKASRPFEIIKIALERPRQELYQRIDLRMDYMIAQGLLEETKNLQNYQHHNALQTVGYQEIFAYLKGEYDWEEAVRLLKRNSRRYAKRQMTWFKKDTEFHWFSAIEEEKIWAFLAQTLTQKFGFSATSALPL
jgi:tRNA dimethylallyltransferase